MRTLLVVACLAAFALSQSVPSVCYGGDYYELPQESTSSDPYSLSAPSTVSSRVWCFKYSMKPTSSKDDYVSLRRRTRFNSSSSYLYFCASADSSTWSTKCTYADSYYNFYATSTVNNVYGRVEYSKGYGEGNNGVYFEVKHFLGNSGSAWSGYCTSGNCASRGACLTNGSCWCDEGHSGCDVTGLLEWIIYLIVVACIILVLVPIIIIICCCCCCAACAAGAAAAAR